MRFKRKGYGRIYTDLKENITKIREIIRIMDEYEYDYLPGDLIAVYEGHDEPVYNGKFYDLDLDALLERCQRESIPCRVVVVEDIYDDDTSMRDST